MQRFLTVGLLILTFVPACVLSAELGPCVDVAFIADADGSSQRYVLRLPSDFDPAKPHDLLIALHGHGSDRWQFASSTQWTECVAVRDFAAGRNMILVCPDYRATMSWMGPLAEKDVVQMIEELRESYLLNRVFMCGGSMGGSSALTFTVLHPRMIDGVVALNPLANHLEYENFQDAISASYGGSKQQIPGEYKKRSAEYWPERFLVPVGISTGGQDTIVPPASVMRLANVLSKIGKKVKFIHRESTGHSTSYADTMELLTFMADAIVHTNVAVTQLYAPPGAGLVCKYPGIPSPPSSGSPDLQYTIGTTLYDRGVSIGANGAFRIMLGEPAATFRADIGLYSGVCNNGDVMLKLCRSDNPRNVLWQSAVMLTGQQAVPVTLSLSGMEAVDIIIDKYDADNFCDCVIFANARIVLQSGTTVYLDEAQGDVTCFLETDLDGNCQIDLNDLFRMAQDWLVCGYEFSSLCEAQ